MQSIALSGVRRRNIDGVGVNERQRVIPNHYALHCVEIVSLVLNFSCGGIISMG